ncbi:hypothetical protein Tco_0806067 [Tanacetum coccineum]
MKLSMKKLEILKKNIKFRGGLLGLKDFMMILELLLLRFVLLLLSKKDNRISLNDGVESNGEWDTLEYHDTTDNRKKKKAKAFTFYRMETEDISEIYDAPCFVNGLEAYDGKINLEHDKNMISNEFAVKLCLEHEVKNGDKVVKELIIALKG